MISNRWELASMKIAIVLGTRPEIIKMSPIIRECKRLNVAYFILHTGQHYSYNMDKIFFERLQLPTPKHNLNIGSGTHAEETAKALVGIEKILLAEKPSVVLVQGDTNTVLAGALAAAKLKISVGHVEAGLRSYDKEMPEEINRVLTDHISDFLFAPTERAKENLLKEGILPDKIHVTGNTIVDSLMQNISLIEKSEVTSGPDDKEYFLLTLHREENVDSKEKLKEIFEGLKLIYEKVSYPVIYPVHPRTRKRLNEFNLTPSEGLTFIDPVDYLAFLRLERNAKLILTDSGGVQEEACILKVPCVTLRHSTERPETIDVGANTLVGTNPVGMLKGVKSMLNVKNDWVNPFGDGTAAKQIINILMKSLIR
jgi:UDP-N-acetylglucosamine 2-epimerase (non-hydrolysing)